MDRGGVRADGTLDDVRSAVTTRRVRLRAERLPQLAGVERSRIDGEWHELWTSDSDALVRRLVTSGAGFRDLHVSNVSLEEAFLALTTPSTTAHHGTQEVAR